MSRFLAPLVLATIIVGVGFSVSTAAAPASMHFNSLSLDLPFGDRMFDGPDADAINNNCLACHSAGMVLNQPKLPRKVWEAEVEKMRAAYKAPVAEEDVKAIVDYLTRIKGSD